MILFFVKLQVKLFRDQLAISIEDKHFEEGLLKQSSNIRPNRLFTADQHIVLYKIGRLKQEIFKIVVEKNCEYYPRLIVSDTVLGECHI